MKSHDFKRFFITILLFLQFFLFLNVNSSIALVTDPQPTIEKMDLEISRNITVTNRFTDFTMQKMLYQLTSGNQEVFAAFMIRNTGQELKKLTITVTIDNYEWEQVFRNVENLLDISYDFSLNNELVIPLKELDIIPEISNFKISFALEYYLSVTEISASFQLFSTKLVQVSGIPRSNVFCIPNKFLLRLSTFESLQYRNRFILNTYILTNIPPQNTLYLTLHLATTLQFESLSLLGAAMTSTNEQIKNFNKVEMLLDKNLTKIGLHLKMMEVSKVTEGDVTLGIESIFLSSDHSHYGKGVFREINLPDHPIPGELMFILLVLVLFGVPLYLVYKHQEEEAKKRLNILGRVQ